MHLVGLLGYKTLPMVRGSVGGSRWAVGSRRLRLLLPPAQLLPPPAHVPWVAFYILDNPPVAHLPFK